jgi:hypothetical protein
MFTQPAVPSDKILTRYIAPYGLTALLKPSEPGQPVESFWVGGQRECGLVLFVSALDAEIFRQHARTIDEEWVRHPLEAIGFQFTVEQLGQAWTHLAFGFNANAHRQLTRDSGGCLVLPCFPECFGPLTEPSKPVTFRFQPRLFEAMESHWKRIDGAGYADAITKINRLGITASGANELSELAAKALRGASFGPLGEPGHEQTDWAVFSPDSGTWCFGPNQQRLHLH